MSKPPPNWSQGFATLWWEDRFNKIGPDAIVMSLTDVPYDGQHVVAVSCLLGAVYIAQEDIPNLRKHLEQFAEFLERNE
jgi:hypothetical protein